MLDYLAWKSRCGEFCRTMQSRVGGEVRLKMDFESKPLWPSDIIFLEQLIGRKIPPSLARFFAVLGGFTIRYAWEPPAEKLPLINALFPGMRYVHGGPEYFCLGSDTQEDYKRFLKWAQEMEGETEDPDDPEFQKWRHAFPFLAVGNGDSLGFDLSTDAAEPPILYLCHETYSSRQISPDFETFLNDWEKLRYIGPEIWVLGKFIDSGRTLDTESPKAQQLRNLFDGD